MNVRDRVEQEFGQIWVDSPEDYVLDGLAPIPVAAPVTLEQAQALLRLAASEDWAVIPAGKGRGLHIGNLPTRADLIISTIRLHNLLSHEAADMVAVVQAGCTLQNLQKELAKANQWLPIDPPYASHSTLGGIVATASTGALRYSRGSVRDYLIGIKVIHSDGRITKAGGTVVKNVAGYDLMKLYTGSYGTLALLVELNFKLRPAPPTDVTIVVSAPEPTKLLGLIPRASGVAALNLLSPQASCRVLESTTGWTLAFRLIGTDSAICTLHERLNRLLLSEHLDFRLEDSVFWQRLEQLDKGWAVCLRIPTLPSQLEELLKLLETTLERVCNGWAVECQIGSKTTVYLPVCPTPEIVTSLRQHFPVMLERAPVELKRQLDCRGLSGAQLQLMKAIKKRLDPADMFSPGRMF